MHQPDPYQDPPAYRWRQCGLAASRDVVTDAVAPEAWEYVVTVRPVVEDDASKPWTLSADLYAMDVVLRHEAEGSFADTMSMRDLLDFLESDQGVSLTVREALALLRVGTRAANHPGASDRSAAWAPSGVAVEHRRREKLSRALGGAHRRGARPRGRIALDVHDDLPTCGRVRGGPGARGSARRTLQHKLAADAKARRRALGAAVAAREAEALDAARHCAEAARAAVSALAAVGRRGRASARGERQGSLAKGSAAACLRALRRPRGAEAQARRCGRGGARRGARGAAAARRDAGDEMARGRGRGSAASAFFRFADARGDGAGRAQPGPPRKTKRLFTKRKKSRRRKAAGGDADKRRRVGVGGGLRLNVRVAMDAGEKERG